MTTREHPPETNAGQLVHLQKKSIVKAIILLIYETPYQVIFMTWLWPI